MAASRKMKKGSGKVRDLSPRKLAGAKGENVKGGGGELVATMATLDVRSRSLNRSLAGRIPLNHAV